MQQTDQPQSTDSRDKRNSLITDNQKKDVWDTNVRVYSTTI